MTTPIEVTEEDRQKALDCWQVIVPTQWAADRPKPQEIEGIAQALAEARSEGRRDTERLDWLQVRSGHVLFTDRGWFCGSPMWSEYDKPFKRIGGTVRAAIDAAMEAEDSARRTE